MIFHGAAYLEAKDGYGYTALHFASGKLNVIKILIENGAQTAPNTTQLFLALIDRKKISKAFHPYI